MHEAKTTLAVTWIVLGNFC